MSPPALLGVDGGGTSTIAWLADAEGRVLGRGRAGPSNIKAVGPEAARAALDGSIGSAFADAGLPVGPVAASCLGLAGFDRPDDRRWLDDWARGATWAGRLLLVNDGELVVAAGTLEGWGVGVIAGTGSIAVGRGPDGRTARSGGWGPLFGDEGSGYAVARAGLRKLARRADGRENPPHPPGADPLAGRLCAALGIGDVSELVSAVYREGFDRTRVAALAWCVVAAAADDPSLFAEILEPAGLDLAEMALAVARGLGRTSGPLPIALAGGFLLNSPGVASVLVRRLTGSGYEVAAMPVPEPVAGALILARRTLAP